MYCSNNPIMYIDTWGLSEKATYTALVNNPDRVAAMQAWLNHSKNANLSVDGAYGPITQGAVESYQKSRGFSSNQTDGLAGNYTLSYMGFTQDGYFNEEKFEYWVNIAASEYGYTRKYSTTYYIDASFVNKEIIQPETTEKSYIEKSINQVVLGNFTDDTTLLGIAAQVGIAFTGLDVVTDARDIAADVINWEWSWGHAGQTALDVVAFVPVVGVVKYGDEAWAVVKNADGLVTGAKSADSVLDGINDTAKGFRPVNNMTMKTNDALDAAEEWLGVGYKDMGNSRFVSKDGTKVVRMGNSDITGKHGGGNHMNFEELIPNPNKEGKMMVKSNYHIYLID